jgi:CheY-like chemotaxis protein
MLLSGIRAVIVEDNLAVARSLKCLLESCDCEVTGMVATPAAALDLIAHAPFDVALLDIQLAGGDVALVATRVRERGGSIVYVTGYGDLALLPRDLRGAPHLVKPVDPDALLSAILDVVGRVRREC